MIRLQLRISACRAKLLAPTTSSRHETSNRRWKLSAFWFQCPALQSKQCSETRNQEYNPAVTVSGRAPVICLPLARTKNQEARVSGCEHSTARYQGTYSASTSENGWKVERERRGKRGRILWADLRFLVKITERTIRSDIDCEAPVHGVSDRRKSNPIASAQIQSSPFIHEVHAELC